MTNKSQLELRIAYIARVNHSQLALKKTFKQWDVVAKKAQSLTIQLIPKLHEAHKNVNVAKIVGSSVGLIGGIVTVVGIVTTPLTFGASSILIAAGAGISTAGGLTAGGAYLAEFGIQNVSLKDVRQLGQQLAQLTKEVTEQLGALKLLLLEFSLLILGNDISDLSKLSEDKLLQDVMATAKGIKMLIGTGLTVRQIARIVAGNTDDAVKVIFPISKLTARLGATTAARVGVAVNAGFAVLGAVVDVYTIVDSSINMARDGNSCEAVKQLENMNDFLTEFRCIVETLIQTTNSVMEGDLKVILELVQEVKCRFCKKVSQAPIAFCPSCQSLLGCKRCVEENRHYTCTKCCANY